MSAVDYFSGMGGTTQGAADAGVAVTLAANHWPAAVEIHRLNHPTVEHVCQDLMEIDHTSLSDLRGGLLLASPSCRGLSEAGQPAAKGKGGSHPPDAAAVQQSQQRERNTAWAVISAAESFRPRSIMVENVPKLQKWTLFRPWLQCLEALGYTTRVHTLDAARFGSGQRRLRTIVTASLAGAIDLPATDGTPHRSIGDCLEEEHGERWRPIAKRSKRMRWRMKKAQNEAGAVCFWANVSESRGREFSEPFPTATRKSLSQWYILAGDDCRLVAPREMASSMSFPRHYTLPRTKLLAGPMLGNAIDCRLAAAVIRRL